MRSGVGVKVQVPGSSSWRTVYIQMLCLCLVLMLKGHWLLVGQRAMGMYVVKDGTSRTGCLMRLIIGAGNSTTISYRLLMRCYRCRTQRGLEAVVQSDE